MQTIVINMETEQGKLVAREIDISNFAYGDGQIETNPEKQFPMLHNWMRTRGDSQHNTTLQLINWYIK